MTRHYYAAHNTHADLCNGNHGFQNTWDISRFDSQAKRDTFVVAKDNQLAKAVTRKEAIAIFRDMYLCIGKPVPQGGLFNGDIYRFWNDRYFG